MAEINGVWSDTAVSAGAFTVDLGAANCVAGANQLDIYSTGPAFPFAQTLSSLRLKTS